MPMIMPDFSLPTQENQNQAGFLDSQINADVAMRSQNMQAMENQQRIAAAAGANNAQITAQQNMLNEQNKQAFMSSGLFNPQAAMMKQLQDLQSVKSDQPNPNSTPLNAIQQVQLQQQQLALHRSQQDDQTNQAYLAAGDDIDKKAAIDPVRYYAEQTAEANAISAQNKAAYAGSLAQATIDQKEQQAGAKSPEGIQAAAYAKGVGSNQSKADVLNETTSVSSADKARQFLIRADVIRPMLQDSYGNPYTGTGAQQVGEVMGTWPGQIVAPGYSDKVNEINNFSKYSAGLNAKDTYGSRVTNFDMGNQIQQSVSMTNTPAANQQILYDQEIAAYRTVAHDQFIQAYSDKYAPITNLPPAQLKAKASQIFEHYADAPENRIGDTTKLRSQNISPASFSASVPAFQNLVFQNGGEVPAGYGMKKADGTPVPMTTAAQMQASTTSSSASALAAEIEKRQKAKADQNMMLGNTP